MAYGIYSNGQTLHKQFLFCVILKFRKWNLSFAPFFSISGKLSYWFLSFQTSGFAVVADKLNFMRYLSHFRCVHRGAFFAQMRTTSVRKLLPEAWGFFGPVHTPDGAPCGLLNHLSAPCKVRTFNIMLEFSNEFNFFLSLSYLLFSVFGNSTTS